MSESVTMLMARQAVQIVLDDVALAAELRGRVQGFLVDDREPWLRLDVELGPAPRANSSGATVASLGPNRWKIETARATGLLEGDGGWHASGQVTDIVALNQLLNLCLSLAFPGGGILMVHADTVELDDGAIAFLGPSGTGKSTLASRMVELSGASLLAEDRTMLFVSESPKAPLVVAMPRIVPSVGGSRVDAPLEVPLGALVFPHQGSGGPRTRRLGLLEAHQRLLGSVIVPRGEGQPVDLALALAQRSLDVVCAHELSWALGDDLLPIMKRICETTMAGTGLGPARMNG